MYKNLKFAALSCCLLLFAADNSTALANTELTGEDCVHLDEQSGENNFDYAGWRCADIILPEIDGTIFQVRLRWNRPEQENLATVVWLAGGDGRTPYAVIDKGVTNQQDPRPIRTKLDDDHQIRSIEIQFRNQQLEPAVAGINALGGYWAPPRSGYLKAATALDLILRYLESAETNLIQGYWLTLAGGSNGATIIAFGLAYLGFDKILDSVVLVSGPFLVDILRECGDSDFEAYVGINDSPSASNPNRIPGNVIRSVLSAWNGWPDCGDQELDATQRSTLGPYAQQDFNNTDIAVIMGAEDAFGPWILKSNELWFDAITARSKSRQIIPEVGHDVFGADAPPENPLPDDSLYQALTNPPVISEGLFTINGRAIYYSNGLYYCYFPTMEIYQILTGKSDISSIQDYQLIPKTMIYVGACGAEE